MDLLVYGFIYPPSPGQESFWSGAGPAGYGCSGSCFGGLPIRKGRLDGVGWQGKGRAPGAASEADKVCYAGFHKHSVYLGWGRGRENTSSQCFCSWRNLLRSLCLQHRF